MDPQDFVSKHLGGLKLSRLIRLVSLPSECVCGAKAPTVTVAPSLESRASHASPTSPDSGHEIFRRLQELEKMKAALSQLEAEERIAQANVRPDPAWDPSIS